MVLEACMMILDNSEFSRNGDYPPSRLEAQNDAATLVFNAKTQSNPENTVGILTLAEPELLVTLTQDIQKILSALHTVHSKGNIRLTTALSIATLALKHRQNKNQRQRIILFIQSPIPAKDAEGLIKLGKKLKKNNVAVDVVNFGQVDENTDILTQFVAAVDSNDNSHLLTIPPGPHIISDLLIASPIIQGEEGAGAGFTNPANFEFGVDPNLDPELALALRISMEEEQARQQAANPNAMQIDSGATPPATSNATDDELAQALAMSMGAGGDTDMTEEEEIQRAIAMSMNPQQVILLLRQNAPLDPSFLGTLPGVDPNDPRIKNAGKKDDKGGKK